MLGPVLSGCKKSVFRNQKSDQKPINAKICLFSLIGHIGTRAIFSTADVFQLFIKSTAADKKSWKGTWEVTSRTPVECMPSLSPLLPLPPPAAA